MPLVSVIMNCHNCSKYLPQALDSVYQQTFKDYEIIFWDNKSTDNSAEIALNYGEPLRYFREEEFLPLGAARNAAIEKAAGKYIALLDCDDMWLPEKLERQIPLLESDPDLGLVFSDSFYINDKGDVAKATVFDEVKPYSEEVFFNLLTKPNFIPCLTAIFRKEIHEKVGGFKPYLKNSEEHELFLRIAYHYKVSYIPTPLAKYRLHEGNYYRENWAECFWEAMDVIEKTIDMLPALSKAQANMVKKRLVIMFASFLLINIRKGKYTRALVLPFQLTKKYLSLSERLKGKIGIIKE